MKQDQRRSFCCLWLASCSILSNLVLVGSAQAQIVPDASLPQRSRATSRGNTTIVTGGTQSGTNLFHSFEEFSVSIGGVTSFQDIDPNVDNLISRITGSSISNIDGVLEALQTNGTISSANFFLVNPNGIVFGPNASLNLGGSFLATTANRLDFADGFQFQADGTQSAPLLTVSVPVGLQLDRRSGTIVNQSRVNLVRDGLFNEGDIIGGGLQVASGRTLALVGNGLSLPGGVLTTEGGQIELGSVAGRGDRPAQVNLQSRANGWNLDYAEGSRFQDIQLSQGSSLNTSGAGGGRIELQGREITLTERSTIASTTQGNRDGRAIRVWATQLNLSRFSEIRAFTLGAGNSGNIRIRTAQLRMQSGGRISAATLGAGNGGNVAIAASESVVISGRNTVQVTETGFIRIRNVPSISARTTSGASGRGGSISIATETLRLEQGGQVSTFTFGIGDAGTIDIRANAIELTGVLLGPEGEIPTSANNRPLSSGLFTGTAELTRGNGGDLTIITNQLSLSNGAAIQANTRGKGSAGNVTIRASKAIEVNGTPGEGLFPSSILATSGDTPIEFILDGTFRADDTSAVTGRSGNLRIFTEDLQVRDTAVVAVDSLNSRSVAGGGTLEIQAGTIRLEGRGRISAETASGDGGDIVLQSQDLLFLRQNSEISTSAGRVRGDGSGGNIEIDAAAIVAVSSEDSNIRADAYRDRGGTIDVNAQGILGIEPRLQNNPISSDITASSELNVDGTIQINSTGIDPSRGLEELPEDVVDVVGLMPQRCSGYSEGTQEQSEFIITGSGGLPPTPAQPTSTSVLWDDLRPPIPALPTVSTPLPAPTSAAPVVEAQSWVVDQNGDVLLIAEAAPMLSVSSAPNTWQPSIYCHF